MIYLDYVTNLLQMCKEKKRKTRPKQIKKKKNFDFMIFKQKTRKKIRFVFVKSWVNFSLYQNREKHESNC